VFLTEEVIKSLLAKRQIPLIGSIDDEMQERISIHILHLNAISCQKITLFIDSYGGIIGPGEGIQDSISVSEAPIEGVVIKVAASAAFSALQACARRKAYPHASLMFHAPSTPNLNVDSDTLEETLTRLRASFDKEIENFSDRSGQSKKKWREWGKIGKYFDAPEALGLGMIDEIIEAKSYPLLKNTT
jgi:ATP-dependent protease ClpP protease subunit